MSAVDAGVVFVPRYTTLVGAGVFTTAPIDVSMQGGVQFQVWRGPFNVSSGAGTLTLYLEESLDCESWALGPSTPAPITIIEPVVSGVVQFFSYDFRLKWFRLRFETAGNNPMVAVWAEGILRGGGGGMWGIPAISGAAAGEVAGYRPPADPDPWEGLRDAYSRFNSMAGQMDIAGILAARESFERARRQIDAQYRSQHGGAAPPPPPTSPIQRALGINWPQSDWNWGANSGAGTLGMEFREDM